MTDKDKHRRAANEDKAGGGTSGGAEMAFDPIEAALRQLHETIAAEEIPDDFLDLLDQLDDLPDTESSTK